MLRKTILFTACLLLCCPLYTGAANDYATRKAAALKRCEAINPSESQSGLWLNPDGYRSYFVQSQCFQEVAVQFRDISVCDRVRRRWSLFSSSWGISTPQCRKLVSQGAEADRAELEKERQLYAGHAMQMRSFRVERDGNGRDFDLIPEFSSGLAHGYTLVFEIVDARPQPILLHSDGYYIDPNSQLRIYVRQVDIRERFPQFELNRPYKVRATLILSTPISGNSGYWSDEFIDSVFPLSQRSQSVTVESRF
jgi:hypothetical protein